MSKEILARGQILILRDKIYRTEARHHTEEQAFLKILERRAQAEIDTSDQMLSLENVTYYYPEESLPAIKDITFTLPKSDEIMGLLGSSGSGKSTILRLIAGFIAPDYGSIKLEGKIVAGPNNFVPPEKRNIGIVFQDYALFPHLSVKDNLSFGIKERDLEARNNKLEQIISLIELNGYENRYPHELSGGQQQRVAIGRTLASNPSILLLDEPFSNLDEGLKDSVRAKIKDMIAAFNIPTIIVTHDIHDVLKLADRVVRLHEGKIIKPNEENTENQKSL